MKAYVVVGLGYGDEGKGSMVDYLVRRTNAKLTVRFNGGPQAAHNVVVPESAQFPRRHHTFSQFGSGTFAGAGTFLSRMMLVEPWSFLNEVGALHTSKYWPSRDAVQVDRNAVVITPYHWIANRIREAARGSGRHGSCGFGVGEARSDQVRGLPTLLAGQINMPATRDVLGQIQEAKLEELRALSDANAACRELYAQLRSELPEGNLTAYSTFWNMVTIVDNLMEAYPGRDGGDLVFEGAQGVLLDENHGWAPHNTFTDCTFNNARALISELATESAQPIEVERIGVLRTYATRHGAGPFPSEVAAMSYPDHNGTGTWQGHFRHGHFDMVAARYALGCVGGVDKIALTHCDRAFGAGAWTWVHAYMIDGVTVQPHIGTLRTEELFRAKQLTRTVPVSSIKDIVDIVESELGYPVGYLSEGPMHTDKITYSRALRAGIEQEVYF